MPYRRNIAAALGALIVATATPAGAAAEEQKQAGKERKQRAGKKQLICKLAESTGSRLTEKICMTAEEWKREEALAGQ